MKIKSNIKHRVVTLRLFFVLLSFLGNYVCQAQSYLNIDNIGQVAFNIIHNLNTISSKQFVDYFSSGTNVCKQITGEELPTSYIQENYSDLQGKAKKYHISWNKVKYHSFKYYPPVEEDGILGYKGRLYLRYDEKVFNVVVTFIQYEGRFYLLSIS